MPLLKLIINTVLQGPYFDCRPCLLNMPAVLQIALLKIFRCSVGVLLKMPAVLQIALLKIFRCSVGVLLKMPAVLQIALLKIFRCSVGVHFVPNCVRYQI